LQPQLTWLNAEKLDDPIEETPDERPQQGIL
jgi:hypothetical protein